MAIASAIGSFKFNAQTRDHKFIDILVIGLVSILIHNTVVDHFKGFSFEEKVVEQIKEPPKVQITLTRPKPIVPPPIVQAPPPPPKVVALKPPPKPKIPPKVVERVESNVTSPVYNPAPAAPVTAPVAAPAPVVEKVTAPFAGADYLHNPEPVYPDHAQEMGWEGKVLLKVHVQADGTPLTVDIARSSGHEELDNAAVKAVKKWVFVPGKRGDTPVDGYVTVPISFNL
jgi:protein TonB